MIYKQIKDTENCASFRTALVILREIYALLFLFVLFYALLKVARTHVTFLLRTSQDLAHRSVIKCLRRVVELFSHVTNKSKRTATMVLMADLAELWHDKLFINYN